jgi:Phospholipase_D-nuclease N-terminal
MLVAADYPFLEIVGTMILFFAWLVWIWTVIVVLSDVFRRHDITGWGKAGWTFVIILVPFLGVLVYLGLHGKEMAERRSKDMLEQRNAFDSYVRETAGSGGPGAEIAHAKNLLDQGAIDQTEYVEIKRRALG